MIQIVFQHSAMRGADDQFASKIEMLRADAEDGVIDGNIGGVDYSDIIGHVNVTLQDESGNAVTGSNLDRDNTGLICFARGIEYFHSLFDDHKIIESEVA